MKRSAAKGSSVAAIFAASLVFSASPAGAYSIFFGADPGAGGTFVTGAASDARADFLAALQDVGVEDFEGWTAAPFIPAGSQPAVFAGSPGPVEARMSVGTSSLGPLGSSLALVMSGPTGDGVFPTSGDRHLILSQGESNIIVPVGSDPPEDPPALTIDFGAPIAAFGFYGTGMNDHLAFTQVTMTLSNGDGFIVNEDLFLAPEGDLLFFGIVAQSDAELFSSASLRAALPPGFFGAGDVRDPFGLDDLTIGAPRAAAPPSSVPLPAAGLLLASGVAGLAGLGRRRAA